VIKLQYGRMFREQLDGEHGLERARLGELARSGSGVLPANMASTGS
jgi:hypothetical protein